MINVRSESVPLTPATFLESARMGVWVAKGEYVRQQVEPGYYHA
jgi:hypothetical protein